MNHNKYFLIILIVLILAIYLPSLKNGYIWDDNDYVYKNTYLLKITGLKDIWLSYKLPQYYPLVFTSFWIEHKLWGFHPTGYHVINMLLHILNTLLLFSLLKKVLPKAALLAAIFFAVHPIQVETVAWITERKNLLSLAFFLLACLQYLKLLSSKQRRNYIYTLIFFVCALLSKSVSVCFAIMPILYSYWKEGKINRNVITYSVPFFIIAISAGLNTAFLEQHRVGATGEAWNLNIIEHVLLAGRILVFYLYKAVVPLKFIFFYERWDVNYLDISQWIWPVIAASPLYLMYKYRDRTGRGAIVIYLMYIASIFPALGFINVFPMRYSYVADHFTYISSPFIFIMISAALVLIHEKTTPFISRHISKKFMSIPALFIILIITIFLSFKSYGTTVKYKDEFTLWNDVINQNPGCYFAYNNLGAAYGKSGKLDKAVEILAVGVETNPDNATSHSNLGNAYLDNREFQKAMDSFQKGLNLDDASAVLHNNMSIACMYTEQYEKAIYHCDKAVSMGFNVPPLLLKNLTPHRKDNNTNTLSEIISLNAQGKQEGKAGNLDKALELFARAALVNPDYADTYNNIGYVYYKKGEYKTAEIYFMEAIKRDPDHPQASENLRNMKSY